MHHYKNCFCVHALVMLLILLVFIPILLESFHAAREGTVNAHTCALILIKDTNVNEH